MYKNLDGIKEKQNGKIQGMDDEFSIKKYT
jgi:hypothetical protein